MNHPYKELESHPFWAVIAEGIAELEENRDIEVATQKDLVVGYILKKLISNERVTFDLSRDEAIVLFECASRFSETEEIKIEDSSEEVAMWAVCASLEKALTEPFRPDYPAILNAARDTLRRDGENSGRSGAS